MAIFGVLLALIAAAVGIVLGVVGGLVGIVAGLLGAALGLLCHFFPAVLLTVGIIWLVKASSSPKVVGSKNRL
jgi:hypothetical protein